MRKNVIRLTLCTMLFALCCPAQAQPKKVFRIGYLASSVPALESARSEAIRRALRDLGYIEGQNIAIEYRYAEGKVDRLPELAAELVRLKVDIIVAAGGSGPVRAVKNATKTIPIAMETPNDPVEAGFVESLNRKRIAGFALKSRLPSIYSNRQAVDAGGLMSYGSDTADNSRLAATYIDKILKGANPGDLPVQQPTKFELVINLKTAKQIDLTIPQKVLARADKVIK
jgi:ABC-type uncharacterized transport system substrate-binding protein